MSIYQSIYNIINQYIFNNAIITNSIQDLAVTLVSLTACLFLIAVPFILVWRLIKLFS